MVIHVAPQAKKRKFTENSRPFTPIHVAPQAKKRHSRKIHVPFTPIHVAPQAKTPFAPPFPSPQLGAANCPASPRKKRQTNKPNQSKAL